MSIRKFLTTMYLAWSLLMPLETSAQEEAEEANVSQYSQFPYGHDPLSCFVQHEAADLCESQAGLFQMGRFALAVEALAKIMQMEGIEFPLNDVQATILSDMKRYGAGDTLLAPLSQTLFLSTTTLGQKTLSDPDAIRGLAIYGLEALFPGAFTERGYIPENTIFTINGGHSDFTSFYRAIKNGDKIDVPDLMPFRPLSLSGNIPFVRLRGSGIHLSEDGSVGPANLRMFPKTNRIGISPESAWATDAPLSAILSDSMTIEGILHVGGLDQAQQTEFMSNLCGYCDFFLNGKDPKGFTKSELISSGAIELVPMDDALDEMNMFSYSSAFNSCASNCPADTAQKEGGGQVVWGWTKVGIGTVTAAAAVGAGATGPVALTAGLGGAALIVDGLADVAEGTRKIVDGKEQGENGTDKCVESVCKEGTEGGEPEGGEPEGGEPEGGEPEGGEPAPESGGEAGYAIDPDDNWPGGGYDPDEQCDPAVRTEGDDSMCPCANPQTEGGTESKTEGGTESKRACAGLNQPDYLACFMNADGAAKCEPANIFGPGVASGDAVYFLTQNGKLSEVSGDTRLITVGDLARAAEINAYQRAKFRPTIEASLFGYVLQGEDDPINPNLVSDDFFSEPDDGIQFTPPKNFELTPDLFDLLREE